MTERVAMEETRSTFSGDLGANVSDARLKPVSDGMDIKVVIAGDRALRDPSSPIS